MTGLLDSGANATVLGVGCHERVKKWNLPILPCSRRVRTADGTMRDLDECVDAPYQLGNRTCVVRTLLMEDVTKELILGTDFWNAFNIELRSNDDIDVVDLAEIEVPKLESVMSAHQLNDEQQRRLEAVIDTFPFADPDGDLNCTTRMQHRIEVLNLSHSSRKYCNSYIDKYSSKR